MLRDAKKRGIIRVYCYSTMLYLSSSMNYEFLAVNFSILAWFFLEKCNFCVEAHPKNACFQEQQPVYMQRTAKFS